MAKVVGFYSRGKGKRREIHPITEAKGFRVPKDMTTEQMYRQALKKNRGVPSDLEGFRHTSYFLKDDYGFKKSLEYLERKGFETVVIERGNRKHIYYRRPAEKPKRRIIRKPEPLTPPPPEPKPEKVVRRRKPKKLKIKPPKPRAKLTHLERMHLLASAKQFEIDPQEIDSTLTYAENKKHLHEMARAKGVSEWQISSSEQEAKQWASHYQQYLNNLRGELENAGYTVTSPEM